MKRTEIEALLRDHLRGVHEELATLFQGVERALDAHLARTETLLVDAFDRDDLERRVAEIEKRLEINQ